MDVVCTSYYRVVVVVPSLLLFVCTKNTKKCPKSNKTQLHKVKHNGVCLDKNVLLLAVSWYSCWVVSENFLKRKWYFLAHSHLLANLKKCSNNTKYILSLKIWIKLYTIPFINFHWYFYQMIQWWLKKFSNEGAKIQNSFY